MKDAFDQWWNGSTSQAISDLTIPAEIRNPVMALSPEDPEDREKVNEAVRQYRERGK